MLWDLERTASLCYYVRERKGARAVPTHSFFEHFLEGEREREGNKELTFASHGYYSSFYMEKNLMTTCIITKRS